MPSVHDHEIDLEKGIPQAVPEDDDTDKSAVAEEVKSNESERQSDSSETKSCISMWTLLGFFLGMLTVPISIIILVSLFVLPLPEGIRQNKFIRAASCGALVGFLVAMVVIIVLRSLESRNRFP